MTKEQIEFIKYHNLCARATLYPGKSYEEALALINEKLDKIPLTLSIEEQLEEIVEKYRDLDAYLQIAKEAYNLGFIQGLRGVLEK